MKFNVNIEDAISISSKGKTKKWQVSFSNVEKEFNKPSPKDQHAFKITFGDLFQIKIRQGD